jgi:hypothetical protein
MVDVRVSPCVHFSTPLFNIGISGFVSAENECPLWILPVMDAQLFTLVNAADPNQVFAWGMQITAGDDVEAVVYRRDPITRRTMFGVHDSAEDALARYGTHRDLALQWES